MFNILNKIFYLSKNLNFVSSKFSILKKETSIEKIFKAIENYSEEAEVRYVGGCIRKILNNETIDDIDFAVNLKPNECIEALKSSETLVVFVISKKDISLELNSFFGLKILVKIFFIIGWGARIRT